VKVADSIDVANALCDRIVDIHDIAITNTVGDAHPFRLSDTHVYIVKDGLVFYVDI